MKTNRLEAKDFDNFFAYLRKKKVNVISYFESGNTSFGIVWEDNLYEGSFFLDKDKVNCKTNLQESPITEIINEAITNCFHNQSS